MHDVYIILGAARSGRRAIVFDLIDGGLAELFPCAPFGHGDVFPYSDLVHSDLGDGLK